MMTDQATTSLLALRGLQAAQQSADAAWAQVRIYEWSLVLTFVSVVFSALIAMVAIRGPERERHTRDLETRKRRARVERRAAFAGMRGLAAARRLRAYLENHPGTTAQDAERLFTYRRRLLTRSKVITHFTKLELRDLELVGWLFETINILDDLREGVEIGNIIGGGYDFNTYRSEQIFTNRRERLIDLRVHFQRFAREKRNKDASLQRDLENVWKLPWLIMFWRKPETARD